MIEVQIAQTPIVVAAVAEAGPLVSVVIQGPVQVAAATLGLQGPPGAGLTVIAAVALGGHRVVTANGLHCDPAEADLAIGITTGAAASGQSASVLPSGPMTEASWTWTPGLPLFIGTSGVLTHTAPPGGKVRRVAFALTPTLINIDFFPPITQV